MSRPTPRLVASLLPLLAAASARAQTDDPLAGADVLTPALAVQVTLAHNTQLSAAQAAVEAARQAPNIDSALPDPRIALELAPLSPFDPMAPFGYGVRASQMLPFPGKLGDREDAALAEARATEGDLSELRLELRHRALSLFADWYQAAKALEVNAQHHGLLEELKRAAQARYAAGMGAQQDALQAERSLAELDLERVELLSHQRRLRARLNALWHRPPPAPIPPPPPSLALDARIPPDEATREAALKARPALASAQAREDAAQARVALAHKAWLPDFELMASYNSMWGHPSHRLMVGLGVEVPLQWSRRRAEAARAEAQARRAALMRTHAVAEVAAEAEAARLSLAEAVEVLALQRDRVLPAARAELESSRASFTAGQTSFSSLIDAERAVRSATLRLHVAEAQVVRASALLARATGGGR